MKSSIIGILVSPLLLTAQQGGAAWTNAGPSDFAASRIAGGFPKDGFFASGNLGQRIYIVGNAIASALLTPTGWKSPG